MNESAFEYSAIYSLKNCVDYAAGGVVSKQLMKNKGGNVTLFAFDKDQGLSEHTAPFDALVQVLEGTVRITIDQNDYILNEGEIIIMPANIPHALKAIDRFKMALTMIKE